MLSRVFLPEIPAVDQRPKPLRPSCRIRRRYFEQRSGARRECALRAGGEVVALPTSETRMRRRSQCADAAAVKCIQIRAGLRTIRLSFTSRILKWRSNARQNGRWWPGDWRGRRPGPLTLVVPRSKAIPTCAAGGRWAYWPSHHLSRPYSRVRFSAAAPSANLSIEFHLQTQSTCANSGPPNPVDSDGVNRVGISHGAVLASAAALAPSGMIHEHVCCQLPANWPGFGAAPKSLRVPGC